MEKTVEEIIAELEAEEASNIEPIDPKDLEEVAEFFNMDVKEYANMHDYQY